MTWIEPLEITKAAVGSAPPGNIPRPFGSIEEAGRWYGRWFADVALPFWASVGFDARRGSFHERIGEDGPDEAAARRAKVQARQIWVYATAARRGLGAAYLDLARTAYANFLRLYRRSDGLFVTSVRPDGEPEDAIPRLYEQAFALLAMGALQLADPAEGTLEDAGRLRSAIAGLRHSAGGFVEAGDQPFQSNAHMHLLEAALAWGEAGDPEFGTLADEVAELALTRFIDAGGGFLREYFDAAWRPAPGDGGQWVEPGHQYEWAWLLKRWGDWRGDPRGAAAARRLFEVGQAGLDRARGVAVNVLWDDLTVRDATARLWPQTEHLKAALLFGGEEDVLVAARGLAAYLDKPTGGHWRDVMGLDGAFDAQPTSASSFYHLAGACFALADRGT